MSKACPRRRYRGSDLAVTAPELKSEAGVGRAAMAEKRLAKEIAEQFLADDESVDLEEFTELGVGPAQIFPSKPI
tara:strand:- start:48 stop:272 length:225 start_codon:yes stop_codon:yes gene_type:complete